MTRPDLAEVTSELPRAIEAITREDLVTLNGVITEEAKKLIPPSHPNVLRCQHACGQAPSSGRLPGYGGQRR
jgi:hypothetical protein